MKKITLSLLLLASFNVFGADASYDLISENYQKSKEKDNRRDIDDFNVFFYIDNLKNKSVLDLACGEGHYARKFKDAGAKKVHGVDLSSKMIDLAKKIEEKEPKGIEYSVANVAHDLDLGQFDIVSGIFLLHYASDKKELCQFTKQIFQSLKPGGSFLGLNANPESINFEENYYKPFGMSAVYQQPVQDGSIIQIKLYNKDSSTVSFNVHNYYLQTYLSCLKEARLENIEFLPLLISPNAIAKNGWNYWLPYIQKTPLFVIKAKKPASHSKTEL